MKLEGKDLEYFLKCCEEAGIKVTPGTGKVTINGELINVKEVLMPLLLAKGEVELRTERIEDGDGDG